MALYVLGDTHLSTASDKPMDVFGGAWDNYVSKLRDGLSVLTEDDTIVLCGDISWGMSLEEAAGDFRFLAEFPGRKIILKGNHDYWWDTVTKINRFFEAEGITGFEILHNNCLMYGDTALCGTRGWSYDAGGGAHDVKILAREVQRLETSLKAAGEREKLVFLHYPPVYYRYRCEEILEVLSRYGIKKCFYGHIHGPGHRFAVQGPVDGIDFTMVSADYLGFKPLKLL